MNKAITKEALIDTGYARFAIEGISKGEALPVFMLHVSDLQKHFPTLSEDQLRYAIHVISDKYDTSECCLQIIDASGYMFEKELSEEKEK